VSIFECPRVDDAAGYVLSALPDGDADAYRDHVAECRDCAAKVQELGFVSHALLNAVPQFSAPGEIRGRVMSVVRAESELLLATGATADRPMRAERRMRFGLGWLTPLGAGALATVLLAVGIGAGVLLQGGSDANCTTRRASVTSPGATAKVEVCDGNARLALAGMKAPAAGSIYELWIDDPKDHAGPKPANLFSVHDGSASVDVGKLNGHRTLLVTQEQAQGSDVPTSKPIVTAAT
jgi:Anti-sigma-K factor rskA